MIRDPAPVIISCSFVPANWPSTAWTTLVGGWIVNEYKNIFEVVAMMTRSAQSSRRGLVGDEACQLVEELQSSAAICEVVGSSTRDCFFIPILRPAISIQQAPKIFPKKFQRCDSSAKWMNDVALLQNVGPESSGAHNGQLNNY